METAPLRHRRVGRRRQEHAHRAAAVRLEVDLRGPARVGRAGRAASGATSTPTSPCSPTGCGPSASRASPSTWPTATSPRRPASSSSPTRRDTCSTRATWSPGTRRPTSPWCSSTPARGSSSRPAATPSWPRCCGCPTSSCASTRWTSSVTTRTSSTPSARSSPTSPAGWTLSDLSFIPISALQGDNVVQRSANMPWYEGASLLHHLETVYISSDRNLIDPRLPVQWVVRPQGQQPPRLPRLRRPGGGRCLPAGRRGHGAALGPDDHGGRHRLVQRRARRGLPAHVGDAATGRRRRRVPGRPDLPAT